MLESQTPLSFEVSKWVKIPLLIDIEEMKDLLQTLPSFQLYDVQKVTVKGEGVLSPSLFMSHYREYIYTLKKGEIPELSKFRAPFSSVWSVDENALYSLTIGENQQLIKPLKPIIQTQLNQIRYSREENLFRTQVFGEDSLCWGIQIGFPHLYLNPETYEACKTDMFPNKAFFHAIQKWIRHNTKPTPFIVEGRKMNTPIRLGKKCFEWINSHPQLKQQEILIDRA